MGEQQNQRSASPTVLDMTAGRYNRRYSSIVIDRRLNIITFRAEFLLNRLYCIADDFGNFLAESYLIQSFALPMRREISLADIETDFDQLIQAGFVCTYPAAGQLYGSIIDYEKTQPAGRNGKRVRRFPGNPKESKIIPDSPVPSSSSSESESELRSSSESEKGDDDFSSELEDGEIAEADLFDTDLTKKGTPAWKLVKKHKLPEATARLFYYLDEGGECDSHFAKQTLDYLENNAIKNPTGWLIAVSKTPDAYRETILENYKSRHPAKSFPTVRDDSDKWEQLGSKKKSDGYYDPDGERCI